MSETPNEQTPETEGGIVPEPTAEQPEPGASEAVVESPSEPPLSDPDGAAQEAAPIEDQESQQPAEPAPAGDDAPAGPIEPAEEPETPGSIASGLPPNTY